MKRFVDAAVQTYGRVDVLINNAGLMPQSPLERGWACDGSRRATAAIQVEAILRYFAGFRRMANTK